MKKNLILVLCTVLTLSATAQSVSVSGTLTDADDARPLAGALVSVVGTARVAITSADGSYTLKVSTGESIEFSLLGYRSKAQKFQGESKINLSLERDVTTLDELVVVGYGTMKKSDLTGAVSSVAGEVIKKAPVSTVVEALQGRVAGVTVTSDTGQPGSGATVRIRGIGSITAGKDPLMVVDGIIVDDISFLSPGDIASTEFLKDASSAAIYGSRAANGVILVTTKTGKHSERMNITFEAYAGVQNRWKKLDLMGRDEFIKTYFDINSAAGGKVGAAEIKAYNDGGINRWLSLYKVKGPYHPRPGSSYDYSQKEIDWQDEVFVRNAAIQNYYIGLDGGSEKLSYALSANYFNQAGTIIGSKYDRLNFRLNTSYKARKWLKIGETLSFSSSRARWAMNNHSQPGASILSAALSMGPWDPVIYPKGSINALGEDLSGEYSSPTLYTQGSNPYALQAYSDNRDNDHRWLGSLYAEATLFKGFTLHTDVSFDFAYQRDRSFNWAYKASANDRKKNSISQGNVFGQNLSFTNYGTWARTFGKHDFSIMAGHTVEMRKEEKVSAGGSELPDTSEKFWSVDYATSDFVQGGSYKGEYRRMSVMSRLFYQYDNRYLVTVNFRADANRAFSELWGYFPSVALGWKISEEGFLKNVKDISQLKLRLGWGLLGNDNVDPDLSTMVMYPSNNWFVGYPFGPGNYDSQSIPLGAGVIGQKSRGVKWEKTQHINVGVDFGFWQNKLSGTVDFFIRDTYDMLMYKRWPYYAGVLYSALDNIGTARNAGVEFSLEHQNMIKTGAGPLTYSVGGNMSFINNKVLSTNGADRDFPTNKTINDKGFPLFSFWGYRYDGIFRSQDEIDDFFHSGNAKHYQVGDARYRDLNGDGELDDQNDKTVIGNPFPKFTYGLNFSLGFYGFDLGLFFQGVYGNTIYNALKERTEGNGFLSQLSTSMRDVWTVNNPGGSIPNPNNRSMNVFPSSRFLESGSYLRLKNLQFGYTIPASAVQRAGIQKLRVYFSAANLFTITRYSGYDPEVGDGIDYGNYPQSRTLMMGVNINF